MQEMSIEEIEAVSGGVIPLAVLKIGAWALGAGFGAGMVVALKKALV